MHSSRDAHLGFISCAGPQTGSKQPDPEQRRDLVGTGVPDAPPSTPVYASDDMRRAKYSRIHSNCSSVRLKRAVLHRHWSPLSQVVSHWRARPAVMPLARRSPSPPGTPSDGESEAELRALYFDLNIVSVQGHELEGEGGGNKSNQAFR